MDWLGPVLSGLAALGAIGAALIAGRFAAKTKEAELRAQRAMEIEKRLAASKEEIYTPMVEMLRQIIDSASPGGRHVQISEKKLRETLSKFWTWVQMYGSDDALRASHRFSQALYSDPPPRIAMRYLHELLLSIRRDLGHPETEATLVDLAGLRVTDIHQAQNKQALTMPEEELWARENWKAPWRD
jgi:hypothetical protein